MPTPIDPRGQDNPSTYFVEDRSNNAELIRLLIQDHLVTEAMGGPVSEQPDPASLHRVLDVGCGPGSWILETAQLYPQMEVVGIDISWRMIEYARAQAQAMRLADGVTFRVMDALRPLEFPDDFFDLVNMRMGASFLLVEDYPRLLHEFLRVTRPAGIIRITDGVTTQSSSPAYNRFFQMLFYAFYRAGHSLTEDKQGVTHELPRLLSASGVQQVQTRDYTLEFLAGTLGGQNIYENVMYGFQTGLPFLQKWGCVTENYAAIYQQALIEMQQSDFLATWDVVTAWGMKPEKELNVSSKNSG